MNGWLVAQLPRPMAEDELLRRFVAIFEEVAGSVQGRIDGIEHCLDVGLAPPTFVRWLGAWLAVPLDSGLPLERQRDVVRAAGRLLDWRGTSKGLAGLLAAYTGGPVQVEDSGGVFPAGRAPTGDRRIIIRLTTTGGLQQAQLMELIHAEVPADAIVELGVGEHAAFTSRGETADSSVATVDRSATDEPSQN
ncbi:MAG: phage tail protein [Actinobacteria bacterium]|nr:phage tail protein [Actinomycetota bacterium]